MEQTKNREKGDFASGSIPRLILRLAVPIIIAELVHILYNIVDRLFIGHIPNVGTESLTGIGLVIPIVSAVSALAGFISTGGATLCSIARGERDTEKACRILENCLTLILIAGIFLTGVLFFFGRSLLYLIGADESTIFYAAEYLSVYCLGTVFVIVSLGLNTFINLQGRAGIGMCSVILGAVLNIILDPVFIFLLDMGIRGAAIATVISQFCSAVWILAFLTRKKTEVRIRRLRLEKDTVVKIGKLGITGFLFKFTNSITQAVSNVMLNAYGGALSVLYIGSMSIIGSVNEVAGLPQFGLMNASQPVISYNYGAKREDRVSEGIRFLLISMLLYSFAAWAVLMTQSEGLIRIFTTDEELVRLAVPSMRIYFAAYFMMAFQATGQSVFVALNYPGEAAFFSLLRKIGLILPLTLILPRIGFGASGVFYAELVSHVVGSTACFLTMTLKVWRKLKKTPPEAAAD